MYIVIAMDTPSLSIIYQEIQNIKQEVRDEMREIKYMLQLLQQTMTDCKCKCRNKCNEEEPPLSAFAEYVCRPN